MNLPWFPNSNLHTLEAATQMLIGFSSPELHENEGISVGGKLQGCEMAF